VVKVATYARAVTRAATDTGDLACGIKPRRDATVTQVSADLADTTCRACRDRLNLDGTSADLGRLEALFVLAITLALRPGELRALTWRHVDLDNGIRSLTLPKRTVEALKAHKKRQAAERLAAGAVWHDNDLVFCHPDGHPYTKDGLNHRFGQVTRRAGIGHWHAHEGRHTGVSIMSSNGVPIQEIADTLGHKSTHVTETVYRHVIVPAIRGGASVMDDVFGEEETSPG
jgi:integrase